MRNNKKWYKLVFKQIQPIHVGAGSYGVINETRIFIPGWTMWGAMTKTYNLKNGEALSKNHDVFENISCFYPCFKDRGEYKILFPKFEKGKFYLGNYSEDKFRAKFVDTFISTAIDSRTNTAIDESLHELNIILPGVKADYLEDEKEIQLYWAGIVQLEESKKDSLPDEIYIGGDARYGLGKMKLCKNNITETTLNDWEIKDGALTNYFPVEAYNNMPHNSKIELLVEIEKSWEKAELQVKLREEDREKGFFYVPGSKFNNTDSLSIKSIKKGVFTKEQTSERGSA